MPTAVPLKLLPRALPVGRPEIPLVDFHGQIPKPVAEFLAGLGDWDRRNVYAVLGAFGEVRVMLGTARLLHLYLKEGPQAAAQGRLTFQEFMEEKDAIQKDVFALRRKVNALVEKVSLRLPRIPRKEPVHGTAPVRRVS